MLIKKKTAKKTEKKEPVQPKRLYLSYNENYSGGNICEGQEDESWPSYEDKFIEVDFKHFSRSEISNRFFQDSYEVHDDIFNLNQAYLAIIRYFDGGSFGRTCGYWYVVGIFKTQKQAEKAIKTAKDGAGYKPWEGHFSGFEAEEVHLLLIGD